MTLSGAASTETGIVGKSQNIHSDRPQQVSLEHSGKLEVHVTEFPADFITNTNREMGSKHLSLAGSHGKASFRQIAVQRSLSFRNGTVGKSNCSDFRGTARRR